MIAQNTMALYRSLVRVISPQLRAMSTATAPSLSSPAAAEEKQPDEDEPIWNMSNPYDRERRKCLLCEHKIEVDYKNAQLISQFVSQLTGKLYDRHITGLCREQQQRLEKAHRIAQDLLLMPHYHKDLKFGRDPQLFDPFKPQRPNPF